MTIQPEFWPFDLVSKTLATTPSPRMTSSIVPMSSARKGDIMNYCNELHIQIIPSCLRKRLRMTLLAYRNPCSPMRNTTGFFSLPLPQLFTLGWQTFERPSKAGESQSSEAKSQVAQCDVVEVLD